MKTKSNLHNYQKQAIQWILNNERCALWMDPGLGKTVTTLTALNELINRFDARFPLIIAPLRVSRSVWPQEAQKWDHLSHMTCTELYWPESDENTYCYALMKKEGLQKNDRDNNREIQLKTKRREEILYHYYIEWLKRRLATKATFYTINREQVYLLCQVLYQNWPFDFVALDESSSFKHSSSKRFKGIKAIQNKIHRVVQLTGSPASNGYMDLWAQIYLLDGGKSLLRSKTAFTREYFNQAFNGFGWEIKQGVEDKILTKIKPLVLTFRAKDHLQLKEPKIILHPLELPEKVNEKYNRLERDYLVDLDEDKVTAVHNAALHNKLHQICNGAVYVDGRGGIVDSRKAEKPNKKRQWKRLHNVKLEKLKSIYEEANGKPILVAYNFKHDSARILRAFPKARKIDKYKDISDWNKGLIPMGVGHPASMGHGLNLQKGGYIGVFFGYLWDRELYDQFIRRLARQGQENSVIIHIIYINRKAELHMKKVIEEDGLVQDKIMNFMNFMKR